MLSSKTLVSLLAYCIWASALADGLCVRDVVRYSIKAWSALQIVAAVIEIEHYSLPSPLFVVLWRQLRSFLSMFS